MLVIGSPVPSVVCCDGVGLLACPFSFGGGGLPFGGASN